MSLLAGRPSPQVMTKLAEAVHRFPSVVAFQARLARAHLRLGQLPDALAICESALASAPDDHQLKALLFELSVEAESWDRAAQLAQALPLFDLADEHLFDAHLRLAWQDRGPAGVLEICRSALELAPGNFGALYEQAVALALLGRNDEACSLIDLERFVDVVELPMPKCGPDPLSFRQQLTADILQNPTLEPDPLGKATREGLQTRELKHSTARDVLLEQIKAAVDDYDARLPPVAHPLVTTRPNLARIRAWAVVYPGAGRQVSHAHPGGWISGVYYVSAPHAACRESTAGALVLGALDELNGRPPPWGIREIEPVPGRLVLFPSYIPHATTPTGAGVLRISIAFDVVRCG